MTAITRLSLDGYGAKRANFTAKTPHVGGSSGPHPVGKITRLSLDGYGSRRAGSFSGKTPHVGGGSGPHPVSKITRLSLDGYGAKRATSFGGRSPAPPAPPPPPVVTGVSGGSEYRRRRSGLGPSGRRKKELEILVEEKEVLVSAVEEVKAEIQLASSKPLRKKLRIELDGLERKIKQIEEEEEMVFVISLL